MTKFKFFRTIKNKINLSNKRESTDVNSLKEDKVENQQKEEKKTIIDYNETLYSIESSQGSSIQSPVKNYKSQSLWRDVGSIEKNIDHINKRDRRKIELEDKVDHIVSKKKKQKKK